MVEANQQGGVDYEIGYRRPPKNTRFKPGQRANPKGRPPGSPNKKAVIEGALDKKIKVRRGDKTSQVSGLQAIAETFVLKAAQGDRQAAAVILNLAAKAGVFNAQNDNTDQTQSERIAAVGGGRPSEAIIESVDPTLLSKDEQVALSQMAEIIDRGGDLMALSGDDLVRLKQIVSKGRGNEIAPKLKDGFKEAA